MQLSRDLRYHIVGGGISGLSTALSILKHNTNVKISIWEGASEQNWLRASACRSLGIWAPGLAVLEQLGVKKTEFIPVDKSSYKSVGGYTLAQPYSSLNDTLAFCDEQTLREELLGRVSEHSNATVTFNRKFSTICGSKVVDDYGSAEESDLLIACDGKFSAVRSQVFPRMTHARVLMHRGYTVFRGHSPPCSELGNDGFQTWGPGRRFAVVPSPQGHAWFAAVSACLLTGENAITADTNLKLLQELFNGWHDPISHLLMTTLGGDEQVLEEEALASRGVVPNGLSHVPSNGSLPMAFVGDASHTLDPILAQGAGVGLEDAAHLAACLISSQMLRGALRKYEHQRLTRLQRLHLVSNIAQGMGHMEGPTACRVRDVLLRMAPPPLKSWAFDRAIEYSLSGREQPTLS